MLDDFVTRALLGGVGIALVAGPLGCFVVWRRMAYFGDALAHSALLGVALALALSIDMVPGVVAVCTVLAVAIVLLQEQKRFSTDTLLGLLSHSALALGLIALGFLERIRIDLLSFLFGDILSISRTELAWIWGGGALVLLALAALWRGLLAATVQEEMARAEGVPALAVRLAYTILLAIVIALAMRLVGILLITSLLLLPAATARRFARTPEAMAVLASLAGALSVAGGLYASIRFDTASGPSVVVAALVVFLVSQIGGAFTGLAARR